MIFRPRATPGGGVGRPKHPKIPPLRKKKRRNVSPPPPPPPIFFFLRFKTPGRCFFGKKIQLLKTSTPQPHPPRPRPALRTLTSILVQ